MSADADQNQRLQHAARRLLSRIAATGVDRAVVSAMSLVERHEFVPTVVRDAAYEDKPLPIGLGQTISQPTLVARMTDSLHVHRLSRVLEVGTGCGYQTAILAELVSQVHSLELEPMLAADAKVRLHRLGYRNVDVRVGDGYLGLSERAPFDAIIVAASAPSIPPALVEQLRPGGRMVLPVKEELFLLTKDREGHVERKSLGSVRFVPLRRRAS